MADTAVIDPPRVVITHPTQQKIDVSKALKLRLQGQTFEQIASVFSCTGSAVHQALSKFEQFLKGIEPGQLTAYSENRAELFNQVEAHLTASLLDADALAKASLNNRAYAFKQIHEARRLETGQSTSNQSILAKYLHVSIEELTKPPASTQTKQAAEQAPPHEVG